MSIRNRTFYAVTFAWQVLFATTLVVNKISAVTVDELDSLKDQLRQLNPHAPMLECDFCDIDIKEFVDGLLRLRGNAKRADLVAMQVVTRKTYVMAPPWSHETEPKQAITN